MTLRECSVHYLVYTSQTIDFYRHEIFFLLLYWNYTKCRTFQINIYYSESYVLHNIPIFCIISHSVIETHDFSTIYILHAQSPVTKLSLLLSPPRIDMLWGNSGDELVQSALSFLSFLSLLQTVIPELQNSNCSGAASRSVSILQVPPISLSVTSLWLCFGYEMTRE